MRRPLLVASGLLLAVIGIALSAGAASLYVYDHGHTDTIAKGVTIAGVDVGGLRAPGARALVERRVGARLRKPVTLVTDRHEFIVHPAEAGLKVDVARMVEDAVAVSRSGSLLRRAWRDLRGHRVDRAIPLRAAVSQPSLERVADQVARVLDRAPKNARVVPTPLGTGFRMFHEVVGLSVARPRLEQRLTRALLATTGSRTVAVPAHAIRPRWTLATLPRRYGTFILISRETFTLRLYKRLKLAKTYPIAVGQQGLETPAGLYEINDKQVNPSWHVPLSSWAGDLAGRVIPPGPDDPIKARWLGFYDGAGIHGTDEDWSIGHAASHGCVRMHVWDVEDLYPRVPLHTPIYVG